MGGTLRATLLDEPLSFWVTIGAGAMVGILSLRWTLPDYVAPGSELETIRIACVTASAAMVVVLGLKRLVDSLVGKSKCKN